MTSTHPVAMATEPAPRVDRMPRFERRVLVGGLLISLPAWAVVAILLFRAPHVRLFWILVPVAAVVTLLLMHWHRRHVAYPVYTLSGLLDALREGDYSLRGARDGLLGDVVYDVNTLAEPTKIAPKKITINNAAPKFVHEFPPQSVTVLKFKTRTRVGG